MSRSVRNKILPEAKSKHPEQLLRMILMLGNLEVVLVMSWR